MQIYNLLPTEAINIQLDMKKQPQVYDEKQICRQNYLVFDQKNVEVQEMIKRISSASTSSQEDINEIQLTQIQGKHLLSSFYKLAEPIYFHFSKFNYYHSLVPSLNILKLSKKIVFCVNNIMKITKKRIFPENKVNIHLFKPFYIEEDDHIVCYVATKEIMKHVLVALFQVHQYYKISHPIIQMIDKHNPIGELIKDWSVKNIVIICRIQSLMTFLLIDWLKSLKINIQVIKIIFIKLETSRLNPKRIPFYELLNKVLLQSGLQKEDFFKALKIQTQESNSIFLYGFNFVFRGKQISAIMLPWGLEMASELTRQIYKLNPFIKRLGIVGGVGYMGDQDCKVDDIFIPNSVLHGDASDYHIESFQNLISDRENTVHFTNHNIVKGCIKSVFPQLGKLSNIRQYKPILHKIQAFDMEFQAILKEAKRYKNCSVGAIYYIMDLPKKEIHLGDTYYKIEFLEALFNKYQRGKNYCFEKLILQLVD